MSDESTPTPGPFARFFSARFFLLGLLIGFVILRVVGGRIGRTDFHPHFVRFTTQASPTGSYYPAVDELHAIVTHQCRKDQVLVIVGGNSILLGVWQPADQIWSRHLQELLGDRYCVVNFAFRGASPNDTGAVMAEALRNDYKVIYIANTSPFISLDPIGTSTYRFMFWQAYVDGLIEHTGVRKKRILHAMGPHAPFDTQTWEELGTNAIDRLIRYKNLWNYVGFTKVFTVSTIYGEAPPLELKPRKDFPDEEPDALDPNMAYARYPDASLEAEMRIVYGNLNPARLEKGVDGLLHVKPQIGEEAKKSWLDAFPADLRPKILLLLSEESPYYRNRLKPDEQVLYQRIFKDGRTLMLSAGIETMVYGVNYLPDDYGDRSHLSKLGGAKLAEQVAPEVRALAQKLHYLP